MATLIVEGSGDAKFDTWKNVFYDNFNPDDWDYMIIGPVKEEVEKLADILYVLDYELKEIPNLGFYMAVTYHA